MVNLSEVFFVGSSIRRRFSVKQWKCPISAWKEGTSLDILRLFSTSQSDLG